MTTYEATLMATHTCSPVACSRQRGRKHPCAGEKYNDNDATGNIRIVGDDDQLSGERLGRCGRSPRCTTVPGVAGYPCLDRDVLEALRKIPGYVHSLETQLESGYGRYMPDMFAHFKSDQAWREPYREALTTVNAACYFHALAEILPKQDLDDLFNLATTRPEGFAVGVTPDQAIADRVANGLAYGIYVVAPIEGRHTLVAIQPGAGPLALVMALYNGKHKHAPHWLPAMNPRARRTLPMASIERVDALQRGYVDVETRSTLTSQSLSLAILEDLDPTLPIPPASHSLPPVPAHPGTGLPLHPALGFRRVLQDRPPTPNEFFDVRVVVGVNVVLPPSRTSAFAPTFYFVGSGKHSRFSGVVKKGFPGPFSRATTLGPTLWELHPAVVRDCHITERDFMFVTLAPEHALDQDLLASGSYNHMRLGGVACKSCFYDLTDPFLYETNDNRVIVFRLSKRFATISGLLGSAVPLMQDTVVEVQLYRNTPRELPIVGDFPNKRAWLRCVFAVLAVNAPDHVRADINDQRNQALAAFDEGQLDADFDPIKLVGAIVQAHRFAQSLMGVEGNVQPVRA